VNGKGRQDEIWAVLAAIAERQNRAEARWEEWRHTAENLMKTFSERADTAEDLLKTVTAKIVDLTERADVTQRILEEFARGIVDLRERDDRLTRHLEVLASICDDLIRNKQDRKKRT
jgi:hypothetical protein